MFGTYVLVCSVFCYAIPYLAASLSFFPETGCASYFVLSLSLLGSFSCFPFGIYDPKIYSYFFLLFFIKRLLFILRILQSSTLALWAPFSALTGSKTSACHPHRISSTSDPHPIRFRSASVFYICDLLSSSNTRLFTAMLFITAINFFPQAKDISLLLKIADIFLLYLLIQSNVLE